MIRIEALILFHTGCIICSDNSKVFKIGSYLHFNFTNTDLHHRDNHHTNFDFFLLTNGLCILFNTQKKNLFAVTLTSLSC